jgi:hypothetical protein
MSDCFETVCNYCNGSQFHSPEKLVMALIGEVGKDLIPFSKEKEYKYYLM